MRSRTRRAQTPPGTPSTPARGFAKDDAGLAASRNTKPHPLQVYRRTANGREELSKDVSVPIWVNARHWGSFRTVYRNNGAG